MELILCTNCMATLDGVASTVWIRDAFLEN